MAKFLNLGCGSRFHEDWINVDVYPSGPEVIVADLTAGVPFSDREFDVVYASHVLEHFSAADGRSFVEECVRVLKPGGICRIVVPDLEGIVRSYLHCLEQVVGCGEDDDGDGASTVDFGVAEANRHWMLLELYDQTMRERSGGEMQRFLSSPDLINEDFILQRIGAEAAPHLRTGGGAVVCQRPRLASVLRRPRLAALIEWWLAKFRPWDYDALIVGRFRNAGEIHKWMYDRYSLVQLMEVAGLMNAAPTAANESRITGWADYQLDVGVDGKAHKPDSLFVEGVKG